MEVGPLGLGSVMALRLLTSSPISTRLLSGRKKELEVSGFIFSFFFFFCQRFASSARAMALAPRAQFTVNSALAD